VKLSPSEKAAAECPKRADHWEHPSNYMAHGEWAEELMKTHRQVRCTGCGLYAIWVSLATSPPQTTEKGSL
jgi:hypothetical protein